MSDDPKQIPVDAPVPMVEAGADEPPATQDDGPSLPGGEVAQERPELMVAGAFAGAFLFAKLLRRIGGV